MCPKCGCEGCPNSEVPANKAEARALTPRSGSSSEGGRPTGPPPAAWDGLPGANDLMCEGGMRYVLEGRTVATTCGRRATRLVAVEGTLPLPLCDECGS